MKKSHSAYRIVAIGIAALLLPALVHATASFTTVITQPNIAGLNDQTNVSTSTIANVSQTSASRTVYVSSLPTASTTSTIGSCVVTYSNTTPDKLACSGNNAIVNFTTHNTTAALASALRSLTSVTDPAHGALTVSGSTNNVIFTTTGVESSTTPIAFTDGTGGAVTSTSTVTAVVPVAQVSTLLLGGTVEAGDQYIVTVPTGTLTYVAQSSDTSLANIATGLATALQASSTLTFNSAASSSTVVLTAKTAGTAFTATPSTVNTSPVAEVIHFTPPAGVGNATYGITINANNYTYYDQTSSSSLIAQELQGTQLHTDPVASCVVNGTVVACTAKTPGTAFTYSTSVIPDTTQVITGGGSTGGSGGGGGMITNTPVTTTVITTPHTVTVTPSSANTAIPSLPSTLAGASLIKKTLSIGSRNNSVKVLQQLLGTDASLGYTSGVTGYYGKATRAAVEAFQVKYGVVAPGKDGYGKVGPATRAMLVKVFGA